MQIEAFKNLVRNCFVKLKTSLVMANEGKESIKKVLWWWGAPFYLISYFITDNFIKWNPIKLFDILISLVNISYFVWHIMAIKKCSPKPPELGEKELKEKRREILKSFLRKLFLKEPVTNWKIENVFVTVDVFVITIYSLYIFG